MTLPVLPLSSLDPVITCTVSPFLIRIFDISEHLRSQRDDLHELLLSQLATDRAEDAGAAGIPVALENHRRVLVEADVRAVRTTALLDCADDDRLHDIALLHVAAGVRILHRGHDDVADAGVATSRTTENPDAENHLRTRVVGDSQPRLL